MIDLIAIKHLVDAAQWILTLGKSDIQAVRQDTETLINDLRKSLDSLYDVVKQISEFDNRKLNQKTISALIDYIQEFYLGNNDLAIARTRCSHVRRDTRRILFKLEHVLHADVSKWKEAEQKLEIVRNVDMELTDNYENNLANVQKKLQNVKTLLEKGQDKDAKTSLADLQRDLQPQFDVLVDYLRTMDKAVRHVWEISG